MSVLISLMSFSSKIREKKFILKDLETSNNYVRGVKNPISTYRPLKYSAEDGKEDLFALTEKNHRKHKTMASLPLITIDNNTRPCAQKPKKKKNNLIRVRKHSRAISITFPYPKPQIVSKKWRYY